ncbi:MAG: phytoene/squalene synthase family protein [Flavobacteriales bacterium]|jgi:phytoene/squalene synthetase|nr:phytoene/squalene synthase family protein [Flavobacteriales bacterium]MBL6869994.1 phytoene/squalene synthase family protein [Flavobacteriales bacterium]|tara:strand:+ start:1713 stop:2549 length:837 start_codon:yes stop_codon:yes gene_type:complete
MIELYHKISVDASKNVTQLYSTSFSMGIKLLDKNIHDAIFSIYGFVRLADEIVDTFHDYPKSEMLQEFKEETYKALDRKISVNPILHAFQMVVNKYSIDRDLIDKFLLSMEQDLNDIQYSSVGYKEYIVGSAEVVGLMCLKVFVNGDNDLYFKLEEPARKLGAAFQKINFLRDVKADYQELGRTYFPGVDLEKFTPDEKLKIEEDIQDDFECALEGIIKLPSSSRLGVYVAYRYYFSLFKKIKKVSSDRLMEERIRVPNTKKLLITFESMFQNQFNWI